MPDKEKIKDVKDRIESVLNNMKSNANHTKELHDDYLYYKKNMRKIPDVSFPREYGDDGSLIKYYNDHINGLYEKIEKIKTHTKELKEEYKTLDYICTCYVHAKGE